MKIFPFSLSIPLFYFSLFTSIGCNNATSTDSAKTDTIINKAPETQELPRSKFDTADYNIKLNALANGDTTGKWPAKFPYPLPGALLPFNRIIAFYGNMYSKKMGILGELPKTEMLAKLKG
ncbi:MAG: hypothetical protein ACRDE8_15530, partial [Ginsengibacter sp.]